jgi:sensor histidine kinase YesM
MKVLERIMNTKDTLFSFEILPPVKGTSIDEIYKTIDPLMEFNPLNINITYHQQEVVYKKIDDRLMEKRIIRKRPGTVAISAAIRYKYKITVVPHMIVAVLQKKILRMLSLTFFISSGSAQPTAVVVDNDLVCVNVSDAQEVARCLQDRSFFRQLTDLQKQEIANLQKEIDEKLPAVRMDQEKILQVLRNLIGNAVKFTPDGGEVRVSARLANREVEVSVSDTGPGIRKENLTTIFEKFHQASTDSSRIKGTGLGLAIVRHVISAHGGRVWAESEPGHGSTFHFVLPA